MNTIGSVAELEALYDDVVPGAVTKVRAELTPLYQKWIGASRFVILTTVGPAGTDASPRGDDGPVVRIVDSTTLWLPDWRGNNRLDSLRNIVVDGRVSLMFMVPGSDNVVRINGTAALTTDEEITASFLKGNKTPRSVVVIHAQETYFQCAKALMRSKLWQVPAEKPDVPTAGAFVKEGDAAFDADAYDSGYAEYAKPRMW